MFLVEFYISQRKSNALLIITIFLIYAYICMLFSNNILR